MTVNRFKQALHLSVATAHDNDVFGKGEVGHRDVGSNQDLGLSCRAWPRIQPIMQLKREGERVHSYRMLERISNGGKSPHVP